MGARARSCGRCAGAALLLAALTPCAPAAPAAPAAPPGRSILVLYSNGRLLPANVEADQGLREALEAVDGPRPELFDEFLDLPRFAGRDHERTFAAYLREKYRGRPPGVVVALGDAALSFVLRHRTADGPAAPVIHGAVGAAPLERMGPLPPDVTGIPSGFEFASTLELALRLHPRARRLVVVTGTSAQDREWDARLRADAARLAGPAAVESWAGLPTADVLERLRRLDAGTVVFTPGYFQDGEGRVFTPRESVSAMAEASGAPIYSIFETQLGAGIVGGFMASFRDLGREAGRLAVAVLDGADPGTLEVSRAMPARLQLDARQVRRWGIDPGLVPREAVLRFRSPSLLEEHRTAVLAAAGALLLQAALIGGLLVERERRRRAEQALQKQRFELAHAARLAVAGELTAAVAHEINQPLGAILANSEAAEFLLDSGPDRLEEVRAILGDIRRDDLRASEVIRRLRRLLEKHEVDHRPFAVNEAVSEVASVLAGEARSRGVTLEVRPTDAEPFVTGDRTQVQQVLLNLLINAMEAVAGLPEERRTVTVSVSTLPGGVRLEVRDRGDGIAPEHRPLLFESFFSTKRQGMGLGLSIARTLVEAHGGTIRVETGPGEGALFRVDLPAAAPARVPEAVRA